MRLDEIQEEIEKDSHIDDTKLDQEALLIPKLHSKYYRIFIDEYRAMKIYETELARLKKEKMEYYLGIASDEVYKKDPLNRKVLRGDLDLHLTSDKELSALNLKCEMQSAKVTLVESFIKTLNNRNFLIKSAIDWRRFQHGS